MGRVQYICTNGTAYIDTNFIPDGNTKVTMEYQLDSSSSATAAFWGCRSASSSTVSNSFTLWSISGKSFRIDYLGTSKTLSSAPTGTHTITMEPSQFTFDDTVVAMTASTNTGYGNLYLATVNTNGTADRRIANLYIFSCKVYDNGTLVRDFIPWEENGEYYLYDRVNSVKYSSATSSAFTGGESVSVIYRKQNGSWVDVTSSMAGITLDFGQAEEFSFSVNSTIYSTTKGMTWEKFINSSSDFSAYTLNDDGTISLGSNGIALSNTFCKGK